MKTTTFILSILLSTTFAIAVEPDSAGRDPKYVETILARSQKIVDAIDICLPAHQLEVRNIIANRYFQLNDIYAKRDSIVNAVKASTTLSSEEKKLQTLIAQQEKDAALYRTHFAFPSALSLYLTQKQIDAVKDGLTYGVLMVTYNATIDMIPSLKFEEKKQIYAWLVEARELAMDAESSNKKHEVFGKYKGRINNYLAARGYNLKEERENWYKRIEAQKQSKKE